MARPARAHDRLPGQRRGLEPARRSRRPCRPCAASSRPARSTSSTSTSRSPRCVCWDALCSTDAPLVGTFHCYSANAVTHGIADGARRAPADEPPAPCGSPSREAAAWTGRALLRRALPRHPQRRRRARRDPRRPPRAATAPLRIVFVGQAVERKGLPVLLRAFEALREHVPAELTLVGATPDEVEPLLLDARGVTALGTVDDADEGTRAARGRPALRAVAGRRELRHGADRGVRRRARRSSRRDIAGYRDVVRDGIDGVLVPRGDATALAEALRALALDRDRLRDAWPARRALHAPRFAWPRVAAEVAEAYEDAIARPPAGGRRPARRSRARPAARRRRPARPRAACRRSSPAAAAPRRRRGPQGRALGVVAAVPRPASPRLALQRIGIDRIGTRSSPPRPSWVLVALALMCASMVVRAVAWHAILQGRAAADPPARWPTRCRARSSAC